MNENRTDALVCHKVLYLDHSGKWSGGEAALLRMLKSADKSRIAPVVVLGEDGPFRESLTEAGIEVHVLPLEKRVREIRKDSLGSVGSLGLFRYLGTAMILLGYARRLARFARAKGATVIHCNTLKSDIYGAIVGRLARIPVIWHVRDHIDPSYLPVPMVRLFRSLARTVPNAVITNSDSTSEKLFPQRPPARMLVRTVYGGLADAELAVPEPEVAAEFRHDPPRIGIVGRISEWKGQHVFIDAARILLNRGVRAQFVIIGAPLFGEDAYEASLRQQASELGGSVEFMGFQRDVSTLLKSLDILVHASTTPEPFGQVVVEGMAEGLPVVGSAGGGVAEIITPGVDGLLTPMGDSSALAEALQELLRDPARANALGRAAWRRAHVDFTARRSAENVIAVYDRLVGVETV